MDQSNLALKTYGLSLLNVSGLSLAKQKVQVPQSKHRTCSPPGWALSWDPVKILWVRRGHRNSIIHLMEATSIKVCGFQKLFSLVHVAVLNYETFPTYLNLFTFLFIYSFHFSTM